MNGGAIGLSLAMGSVFAHQAEAMTVKRYGDKHGKGGMFFNAILCLFAVVFFLISDKDEDGSEPINVEKDSLQARFIAGKIMKMIS